jgi:alkanesulfonate monooxygenase SsuD/methylene tetrahydromethanopterin reductase-like flavin-dependent oxidoreductase (luciferase family)
MYRDQLEGWVLAGQLGCSHIWLAEHHFADDAHNPSALATLAYVAARTQHIRIGTYIILMAFHHPILVAEDAAVVDILSNGRLDLAVGAGAMPAECEIFGILQQETFGRTYLDRAVLQPSWQVLPF